MAIIKLVEGVLISADTNKKLIQIQLEDNTAPVYQPGVDKPHEKPLKTYSYVESEGRHFNFQEHVGRKVRCTLSDDVVVNITL